MPQVSRCWRVHCQSHPRKLSEPRIQKQLQAEKDEESKQAMLASLNEMLELF